MRRPGYLGSLDDFWGVRAQRRRAMFGGKDKSKDAEKRHKEHAKAREKAAKQEKAREKAAKDREKAREKTAKKREKVYKEQDKAQEKFYKEQEKEYEDMLEEGGFPSQEYLPSGPASAPSSAAAPVASGGDDAALQELLTQHEEKKSSTSQPKKAGAVIMFGPQYMKQGAARGPRPRGLPARAAITQAPASSVLSPNVARLGKIAAAIGAGLLFL